MAHDEGLVCFALSFDYGQRHRHELDAARRVAEVVGVEQHIVMPIDLRAFGGSALTADIEVPKGRGVGEMSAGIPVTYVPARNMIFLSFACAHAEVVGAREVIAGVNAVDYSGYPDCRPEFIEAFERAANLATKAGVEGRGVRVRTPLIRMTKAEIIRRGVGLGMDYALTHSCYDPDETGAACGACDSCAIRRRGFEDAGVPDPTRYAP